MEFLTWGFLILLLICISLLLVVYKSKTRAVISMPNWVKDTERKNRKTLFKTDEEKMRFAIALAVENVRQKTGGPFGAAVFNLSENKLIAIGVNRVVPAAQSWAHAEMTALARAQQFLKTHALKDCVLVSSCEPCAMCFGAIPWSGVEKMICGAAGTAAQAIGFDEGDKVPNWTEALEKRGVRVVRSVLADEADEPFRLYQETAGKIY